MSHYGDYSRNGSADQHSRSSTNGRQPLSPISAQQQFMMEARRSGNPYSKPHSSYSGILPNHASESLRADQMSENRLDDSRSVSSSFRTPMTNQTLFSTPSFAETARLDASVSDWIEQSQPHFPTQLNRARPSSRNATPLFRSFYFDTSTVKSESPQTTPSEYLSGLQSIIPPERSTVPSTCYPESINPSLYSASGPSASVLRQRHANHAADDDDASSVFTVASQAPSLTPSLASYIVPSEASTGVYHNAEENVQDVEMMELDESLTKPGKAKLEASQLSSGLSDSDISSDDETTNPKSNLMPKPALRPKTPFSASDAFVNQERGIIEKIVSGIFGFIRLTFFTTLRLIFYFFCLFLFLSAFSVCIYTGVYLWTHHSAGFDESSRPSIDFADLRATLRDQLFGQPIAEGAVVDALESLVHSEEDHKKLLSLHGSTGVGKSHLVNLLKSRLPPGSVHILYPDLVVHDLINRDESASESRSALFLQWLMNRLKRGKKLPLQLIVVENADAHPDLLPEVSVAIKNAVDAHEADLLKTMDMRKENGLTDVLDELIDRVFDVPKIVESSDLLNKNKLVFLFVSNAGFRYVNAMAYRYSTEERAGYKRIEESAFAQAVSSVIEEKESSFFSAIVGAGMRASVIPFVPLKRESLRRCLTANKEFVDSSSAGSRLDEVIDKVLDKAEYFPKEDPTFSVSGCKRISSLLMN